MLSSTIDQKKLKEMMENFDIFEIAKDRDYYKDVFVVEEDCDNDSTSGHVSFEVEDKDEEVEEGIEVKEKHNDAGSKTKMSNKNAGKRKPESTETKQHHTKPSKQARRIEKAYKRQRTRKKREPVPVENILTPEPLEVKGNNGQQMNLKKSGNERRDISILKFLHLFDKKYETDNESIFYSMVVTDQRFEFVKCIIISQDKKTEEPIYTLDRNKIKTVTVSKKGKVQICFSTSNNVFQNIVLKFAFKEKLSVFLKRYERDNYSFAEKSTSLKKHRRQDKATLSKTGIHLSAGSALSMENVSNWNTTKINCSRIAIGNKVIYQNFSLTCCDTSLHISSAEYSIELKIDIQDFEETGYFEPGDENLLSSDDIYSRIYFILRARPTSKNSLLKYAPEHYYETLPSKGKDLSRSDLEKRYIVIEITQDKAALEQLLSLVRKDSKKDIIPYSEQVLQQRIISLISNDETELELICDSETKAVEFPKQNFNETLYADASSKLIEANGKLGLEKTSIFSHVNVCNSSNVRREEIYGKDYMRLSSGEFLNDSIINFWCSWLTYRMGTLANDFFVLNTAFYTLLDERRHPSKVQDHTHSSRMSVNIFEKKIVFVPVNMNIHWSLIAIMNPGKINSHIDNGVSKKDLDLEHPYILQLDSLRLHNKHDLQKNIYRWLNWEFARCNKSEEKNHFKATTCPVVTAEVPAQDNSWDCGVFVCRYVFAMMQIIHKDIKIKCTLSKWQQSHKLLIKDHITSIDGFDFEMKDIARLRKEIATLIKNLYHHEHGIITIESDDDGSVESVE